MKKVIALVAVAGLVLSMVTMASAAHEGRSALKTSGRFQFAVTGVDSSNFQKDGGDTFTAKQEMRQFFDFVASENLKAVMGYDIQSTWGGDSAYTGADATGQIELKRAMMEFTWPETEATVKGGIQFISLPGVAMGYNPVLAGDMGGLTLTTPMGDMADLTIGWSRGYNNNGNTAAPGLDTLFAALPVKMDGFSMAPFLAYSAIGSQVDTTNMSTAPGGFRSGFVTTQGQLNTNNDSASAYWAGTNFELTQMDPIGVKASFIYGALSTDLDQNERKGWYSDVSVDYEMESMTPELFAFYSSGEDDDVNDGSEVMPWIYNDGLTSQGPSIMVGDMTTLGVSGTGDTALQANPVGLWSAGVSLKHIQLMDRLTSTVTASYYEGTSDENAFPAGTTRTAALTEEDSAWDIGTATNYEIYEQLSAILEAAYGKKDMDDGSDDEPITRVSAGLKYSF